MQRRVLITSAITLLLALGGAGATPALAAPGSTARSAVTQPNGYAATGDTSVTRVIGCVRVIAREIRVFRTASSTATIDWLFRGEQAFALTRAGGRYYVIYDGGSGWISADPRWTDPC